MGQWSSLFEKYIKRIPTFHGDPMGDPAGSITAWWLVGNSHPVLKNIYDELMSIGMIISKAHFFGGKCQIDGNQSTNQLWFMVDVSIPTMAYQTTFNKRGAPPCSPGLNHQVSGNS